MGLLEGGVYQQANADRLRVVEGVLSCREEKRCRETNLKRAQGGRRRKGEGGLGLQVGRRFVIAIVTESLDSNVQVGGRKNRGQDRLRVLVQ